MYVSEPFQEATLSSSFFGSIPNVKGDKFLFDEVDALFKDNPNADTIFESD